MMQGKQALKVFICYASEDQLRVREFYLRLKAAPILDPWFDKEKLLPGQNWDLEIRKAIRAADAVLICLSARSVTKEGYVQREIKRALELAEEKLESSIFIIPVRLDDCDPPERLRKWQWVDLFDPNAFGKLVCSLEARATELRIINQMSVGERDRLLYDSYSDSFSTWTRFSMSGDFEGIKNVLTGGADHQHLSLDIKETQGIAMGANKAIHTLAGKLILDYEVLDGGSKHPNLYFCAIPMQARRGLIEVGTESVNHPANATSMYRVRSFIPVSEVGDGLEHSIELGFDFRQLPTTGYTIIGARINEGSLVVNPGHLRLKRVHLFGA